MRYWIVYKKYEANRMVDSWDDTNGGEGYNVFDAHKKAANDTTLKGDEVTPFTGVEATVYNWMGTTDVVLKQRWYPVFTYVANGVSTDGIYGLGHESPEEAFMEGLRHRIEHGYYEKFNDGELMRFAGYVTCVMAPDFA